MKMLALAFAVECPFCHTAIHSTYFNPMDFDDIRTTEELARLLKEGYELIEEDEAYSGPGGTLCEHVALFYDGYDYDEMPDRHRGALASLVKAIDPEEDPDPRHVLSLLMDADGDDELLDLRSRMEAALPGHEISLLTDFVPDSSGPTGSAGANYCAMFLRDRAETPQGEVSRER